MAESEIRPEDYLILICDDEESIRGVLGEAVSGWGFQVATAPNGEAALDFIRAGNLPHIIVTDIRMGGITGIELAEKAKQISPEIEVIIMTSHGTFETAVQAMRIGVYDYLSKPFESIDDVRSVLIHVCERIYLKLYSEYLFSELEKKNTEIEALARTSAELARNLDLARTIDIACRGLSSAFGGSPTVFFQYLPGQHAIMAMTRSPPALFSGTQPKMMLAGNPSEAAFAALATDAQFRELLDQAHATSPEDLKKLAASWKISTLATRGVPRGLFAMLVSEDDWTEDFSKPLLERYIQTISTAFENCLLHAKVVETATRDGLTGLFNVRHFKDRFSAELQLASRLGHPLSLLFFDVDHFKKYNDANGHPAGDQVLRTIAELMRRNFRGTDLVARYGGEEFVVLMPHTSFSDALEKAERFRKIVEQAPFPHGETQPLGKVTVSIGVSEYPSHGSDLTAVIKAADDALYEGKKKSRNVVVSGRAPEGYVPPFNSTQVRSREQHVRAMREQQEAKRGGAPSDSDPS